MFDYEIIVALNVWIMALIVIIWCLWIKFIFIFIFIKSLCIRFSRFIFHFIL